MRLCVSTKFGGLLDSDKMAKAKILVVEESESQYRSIFDSATDSFLIFDTDGNIVEANIQACKMYGYPYEELIKLSGMMKGILLHIWQVIRI